jgi:hypothetical protein
MTETITVPTAEERAEELARKTAIERASYIDGLRALADTLEEHPEVGLPSYGQATRILFYFEGTPDGVAAMAAARRAFPCAWQKHFSGGGEHPDWFDLRGRLHGVGIELYTHRNAVCERVVTGTHEVTETVKDPEKLAEVPMIEVTRTVEDARWECRSILAPADETAGEQA